VLSNINTKDSSDSMAAETTIAQFSRIVDRRETLAPQLTTGLTPAAVTGLRGPGTLAFARLPASATASPGITSSPSVESTVPSFSNSVSNATADFLGPYPEPHSGGPGADRSQG
jgi:hypothetical protein